MTESRADGELNIKLTPSGNVPVGSPLFSMTNFFGELQSHIIDTYMIVLMALDDIISSNMVVKETKLIENLHFAIIDLYNENLLPYL